jgi:hypothetical protein
LPKTSKVSVHWVAGEHTAFPTTCMNTASLIRLNFFSPFCSPTLLLLLPSSLLLLFEATENGEKRAPPLFSTCVGVVQPPLP